MKIGCNCISKKVRKRFLSHTPGGALDEGNRPKKDKPVSQLEGTYSLYIKLLRHGLFLCKFAIGRKVRVNRYGPNIE